MFTGLIEEVGVLKRRQIAGRDGKLVVACGLPAAELRIGESIAVNGACLTVEKIEPGSGTITFHTLHETLRRTNLGRLSLGARVNLERAMRLGDRLGGHLVLGHVDTVAPVRSVHRQKGDVVVRIALPAELRPLLIDKGSIAVDGISLTIVDLAEDLFTVHVIPHTWLHTALSTLVPGHHCNLEADMIGKYVLRAMRTGAATHGEGGLNMQTLLESGFMG